MASSIWRQLLAMDDRIAASGMFPLTHWWRTTLERWYSHPTAKTLVARVGRGGCKSHTAVKVAIAEVLFGDWRVPQGEVHYFAFVSLNKDEAYQRLTLIKQILTVLGVSFEAGGDSVVLPELRLGFRVFACQIGSVSGFRCVGYSADECAKWENADHSANPAAEVCASLDAMCITRPNARRLIISSPWGESDFHFELFERGDQREQVVAYATSWQANPSITREQCEDAARGDPKTFSREYEAIPGAFASSALDPADIAAMFMTAPIKGTSGFLSIDASSLRTDGFAWIAGKYCNRGIHIAEVAELGPEVRQLKMQGVVQRVAYRARVWGVNVVYADQREAAGLESLFAIEKLAFVSYAWSEPSKEAAFSLLRQLMRDRRISIVSDEQSALMRGEMSRCKAHLMPSGRTKYSTTGLDRLSALVTLCHAINEKQIIVSPAGSIDWASFAADKHRLMPGGSPWRY